MPPHGILSHKHDGTPRILTAKGFLAMRQFMSRTILSTLEGLLAAFRIDAAHMVARRIVDADMVAQTFPFVDVFAAVWTRHRVFG